MNIVMKMRASMMKAMNEPSFHNELLNELAMELPNKVSLPSDKVS